jgi:hypothetical protein
MELEFDKEIDAILRKSRRAGASASSAHLDADVIAAFVENALPEKVRSQYTLHFADCDRCRKVLSRTISIREDTVERAAALPLPVSAAEVSVPRYKSIFRTPNLAIAMGGLILVFTGVLGFLVVQNGRNSGNTLVSQSGEQQAVPTPFRAEQDISANSNAASSAPAPQMANSNMTATAPSFSTNSLANTATGSASTGTSGKPVTEATPTAAEEKSVTGRQVSNLPKVSAPPPPPPSAAATLDGISAADTAKADAETEKAKRSDESLAAKRREVDTRLRDLPPAATGSGPSRSGPAQMQNAQNSRNAVQMSVTRSAGGRKFSNRDGAWYDSAYRGQATQNVRRGSAEFKKLDSGLRSIANEIDGVVVVVWKGGAYRIQ